jgi:hypothetical protein
MILSSCYGDLALLSYRLLGRFQLVPYSRHRLQHAVQIRLHLSTFPPFLYQVRIHARTHAQKTSTEDIVDDGCSLVEDGCNDEGAEDASDQGVVV